MALGSTQPLTEMSTRKLPGGKWRPAGRRVRLATSPPSVSRLSSKIWEHLWPVTGIALPFLYLYYIMFLSKICDLEILLEGFALC
jgi:hypothetical protein